MKRTRRRLDTCECVVLYEWDETLPSNQHIHTIISFHNKCNAHNKPITGINNDQELYNNIIEEENGRKNIARDILIQNAPSTVFDVNQDGTRVFKKGVSVSWSWNGAQSPNRILTLIINGVILTTNQRNSILTKLNERFGINKVDIING